MIGRLHLSGIGLVLVMMMTSTNVLLRAQSISPMIVEYQEKAAGQFQITNDTLYPMNVVLEAFGFRADESGKPKFGKLDAGLRVRLSETGFRIGPQQKHTVLYDAEAEELPAWFTIYATITRAGQRPDIQVAFQLPHTVYLLPKRPLDREAVYVRRAEEKESSVQVEIENQSGQFGRVQEVQVVSSRGTKTYPGFPFFPHYRRILSLESEKTADLKRIVLKFPRFNVEQVIGPTTSSP